MTLAAMKNNILRFVPGLNPTLIESTIQDSYRQLTMMEWNQLNIVRTIYTIPFYSTGTVTIDATGIVTPVLTFDPITGLYTGATIDAIFDSTFVGRHMRVSYSDAFFEIASYSAPTITLKDWTGLVITTATTYSIFKIIYSLSSEIKLLFDLAYNMSLRKKSQWYFNKADPARTMSGEPCYYAFAGYDSNNNIQVEVYPVPDATYPLRGYGKRKVIPLTDTTFPILPEDLVENHALLQCYRIKATLEPKAGWEQRITEQAAIYQSLFDAAKDEDYQLASREDKVKDRMAEEAEPVSDTFWASHDSLID